MSPTLSEIVKANSTQEIRDLYEDNGFQFNSEYAFLTQVKNDWKRWRDEHMQEQKAESLVKNLSKKLQLARVEEVLKGFDDKISVAAFKRISE